MKAKALSVLFDALSPFIHREMKCMIWLSPCPQLPHPRDFQEYPRTLQLSWAWRAQREVTGEERGGCRELGEERCVGATVEPDSSNGHGLVRPRSLRHTSGQPWDPWN